MGPRGLELPFYVGPIVLAFYPLVLYLGVEFCTGEFTRELVGDDLGVKVGGTFVRAEGLALGFLCLVIWARTFLSSRTYHLPGGADGEFVEVRKWDPEHGPLALSCLLSPVQVACMLLPLMRLDEDGRVRQSITMLSVAVLHGYGSLLVAHMFLRKESVQRSINNSAYAKEVEFRNNELYQRRKAERQVVERMKHSSSKFFSNRMQKGAFLWGGKEKQE